MGHRGRDGTPVTTVCCDRCGMVFISPLPTQSELEQYYRTRYREDYKGTYEPRRKHVYRAAQSALLRWQRLDALGRRKGTVLDVGAGGGEFLYLMHRLGFETIGVEPHAGYAGFARRAYGLEIIEGPIQALNLEPARYDIITVHHVLEHLPDPVTALSRLRKSLRAGGVLLVEVPNIRARYHSPATRFHRAHLMSFSAETLIAAAAAAGLGLLDLQLVPGVEHLNAAFTQATPTTALPTSQHAREIVGLLNEHDELNHFTTVAPYRRLAANLARPVREAIALTGYRDARSMLDALYHDVSLKS
ncbi:MAG: class I SAM-dependent methyltransferase [Gammaproteobacteria bacterium]|nr:class I SAM-dependent methyltransferase [Gammaproteobacteria bacterium]